MVRGRLRGPPGVTRLRTRRWAFGSAARPLPSGPYLPPGPFGVTKRNRSLPHVTHREQRDMADDLPDLGELEREVMHLVWLSGPLTADEVRALLTQQLTDSTIRTVLRRLEKKGYVRHTVGGRVFVYRAAEARAKVAAQAVQTIG